VPPTLFTTANEVIESGWPTSGTFRRRCARPLPSRARRGPDRPAHAHAMALHFTYYNFVRIHKTLRTTPAMAAGVTERLWEIGEMVEVLEAWEATV